MNEMDEGNENDWQPKDAWLGVLFLFTGLGILFPWMSLIRDGDLLSWAVIVLGGVGWVAAPLCIVIGGNALYQSIKSLRR